MQRARARRPGAAGPRRLQLGRQRVGQVARRWQRPLDEPAQPRRRHLLARRVDRARSRRSPRRRSGRTSAPGSRCASAGRAAARACPGCSFSSSQAWLNQTADDLAALVADPRVDDRQVAPRPAHRDRAHLAGDRGLLLGRAGRRSGARARPPRSGAAGARAGRAPCAGRAWRASCRAPARRRSATRPAPRPAPAAESPAGAASSQAGPLRRSLSARGQSRNRCGSHGIVEPEEPDRARARRARRRPGRGS